MKHPGYNLEELQKQKIYCAHFVLDCVKLQFALANSSN